MDSYTFSVAYCKASNFILYWLVVNFDFAMPPIEFHTKTKHHNNTFILLEMLPS